MCALDGAFNIASDIRSLNLSRTSRQRRAVLNIIIIIMIRFIVFLILPLFSGLVASNILDISHSLLSNFRQLASLNLTDCDVGDVQFPLDQTTPELSPPGEGLSLKIAAVGRGTQNYTCQDDPSGQPAAVGAVATLFDASCIAATSLRFLTGAPEFAVTVAHDALVTLSLDVSAIAGSGGDTLVIGEHYFDSDSTPSFDFRLSGRKEWIAAVKDENVPAPDSAIPGSVPWLKLGFKGGEGIRVCLTYSPSGKI